MLGIEPHVHRGADHLDDTADVPGLPLSTFSVRLIRHVPSLYLSASAPPTISTISRVIVAWRVRFM